MVARVAREVVGWLVDCVFMFYFHDWYFIFLRIKITLVIPTQWAKSPKKQSVGVYFPPSDCFFSDFAHYPKTIGYLVYSSLD